MPKTTEREMADIETWTERQRHTQRDTHAPRDTDSVMQQAKNERTKQHEEQSSTTKQPNSKQPKGRQEMETKQRGLCPGG